MKRVTLDSERPFMPQNRLQVEFYKEGAEIK